MLSARVCDTRDRESEILNAHGCLQNRYEEAAEAYEEGLKSSPGDQALGRGLEDVLKAQSASRAPSGKSCTTRTKNTSACLVFVSGLYAIPGSRYRVGWLSPSVCFGFHPLPVLRKFRADGVT